jgi:hypothetical protein
LNRSTKSDVESSAKCFFPPCPVGLTHAYGVFYAPIARPFKSKQSGLVGGEIFGAHLLRDGRGDAALGEQDGEAILIVGEADAVSRVEPNAQGGGVAGDGAGKDGLDRKGFLRLALRANPHDAPRFIEEEQETVAGGEEGGLARADGVLG